TCPRAEKVREQVDLVDAMAQGCSATLGLPFAPPRHGVVVAAAIPEGRAGGEKRPADGTGIEKFLDMVRGGPGALLEDHGELPAGATGGIRHLVHRGEAQRRWFLDDDVRTGRESDARLLGVTARRSAEVDNVDGGRREKVIETVEGCGYGVGRGELGGASRH